VRTGAWSAIRRPTPTALHVLVAYDLSSLAAKLGSAQSTDDDSAEVHLTK
jgi:hypothetical protein